jgi:hypothetical protein
MTKLKRKRDNQNQALGLYKSNNGELMKQSTKDAIYASVLRIEKEKDTLLELLGTAKLFNPEDMSLECEAAETLISAVDELTTLSEDLDNARQTN